MRNKIKVVWVCHFSNQQVRDKLPLSKLRFYKFLRLIFRKKKHSYLDFAPWVNAQIKAFEKFDDIELHVIAPHKGLKLKKFEFIQNKIFYHFFQADYTFPFNIIRNRLFKKRKEQYKRNRRFVKQFITQTQPDIINLIGTEIPYFSITVLDINNIPIIASMQTVYSNPDRLKLSGTYDKHRSDVEQEIFNKVSYYATGARMHRDLILKFKQDAIILHGGLPIQHPPTVKDGVQEYDFVSFSHCVSNKKGAEDAIDALALVKNVKRDVTLNIVGACEKKYKKILQEKILTLNLEKNIIFHDHFAVHSDMFLQIKKSQFALLPLKLDVISSTIREAMFIGLPVVTYKTSGTPRLNRTKECVLLSDIGNINSLAENMIKILNFPELAAQLKRNAKSFVEQEYDNIAISKRLVSNYQAVIDHYHNDISIPEERLFNTDEFPIY